jgi:hypothetical protein
MRTTFDLPDGLFKKLKVKASLSGITMRQLVLQIIERGLAAEGTPVSPKGRGEPPVIIPARGIRIPALSSAEMARLEDDEDEAKHA